jgi:molecular chaperone HscB
LQLDRGFGIEREALEESYLSLAARYHPDRYASATEHERRLAMEHASLINAAYRTLRDPVTRAEYLVQLGGVDLDSSDPETGAPQPDQAFLIGMLDRREQLEETRGQGAAKLDALKGEVEDEADERLDAAVDALARADVKAAAFELMARRYLQRYADEIDAALAD